MRKPPWGTGISLAAASAMAGLASCPFAPAGPATSALESTYWKVFARAEGGDHEAQNAVAFMLYHGEGVGADRAHARLWFERAARQGNERARRNLAFLASHPHEPAPRAHAAPSRDELGYLKYCGGCHGPNGIAAYENSPSFAFGERLEKADTALMQIRFRLDAQPALRQPGLRPRSRRGELAAGPAAVLPAVGAVVAHAILEALVS